MRTQDWPHLLAEYLRQPIAFQWGQNDCALWVCGWIALLTGTDHAATFRATYDSEQGASAALAAHGYESLEAIADAKLKPKNVRLAQRGEIVLHATGALGICNGRLSHFLAPTGITASPTLECTRAWAIP